MLTVLKILQYLVRSLNSDGTPGQVAAGIALGAALGLTPLLSLHNLVIVAVIFLLNVSVPGALLGWLASVPLGFALDPLFDRLGGALLLDTPSLEPVWATVNNTPVLGLANLNNTVVLGSLIFWLAAALPLFFLAKLGVMQYRAKLYVKIKDSKALQLMRASKLYAVYRWFRPE
ncbi:MAG: TIGR03546 family protein [Gemmatimonadales bacterium]